MATLAKAWRAGGGDVVGLAPTAVAAAELGAAIDTPAETVAKFLHTTSLAADDSRVAAFPPVGPRTLLVVDEAGMVGTKDLAAVVDHVLTRGGSVRVVGDDQQLTAVAASGVFRDLADLGDRTGTTVRLTELHRFADPAEATATLGIRDGDPTALEHYLTRGRVHVGDAGTAADQAYDAWRADITAGRSSLLLAASRDVVRDLNAQARADRLAELRPTPEVRLADGTHASAGDIVVTRHNDRSLRTRSGAWVKNGDRWAVRSVCPGGALLAAPANRRAGGHETVTLPIGYVEQHVQLGYAGTIHGAQGATVDTTHTVLTGTESRQSLYVALSRGRHENHLYLGDGATPAEDVPLGTQPPDDGPRDLLARILDHDERAESATRAGTPDPHHELATLVQQYEDALPLLAQHVLGDERMRALDDALERWMPGLTSQPGYPGLRGQVAIRWADGDSPNEVLKQATWWQSTEELVREDDSAAALARNVARTSLGTSDDRSARWLPAVPRLVRNHESAGAYLDVLAGRINELAFLAEPPRHAPEHDDRLSTGRNHQQRAVPARAPAGMGRRTETLTVRPRRWRRRSPPPASRSAGASEVAVRLVATERLPLEGFIPFQVGSVPLPWLSLALGLTVGHEGVAVAPAPFDRTHGQRYTPIPWARDNVSSCHLSRRRTRRRRTRRRRTRRRRTRRRRRPQRRETPKPSCRCCC